MQGIKWIDRICRWVLGSIFIWAGILKLISPASFVVLIEAYGFMPEILLMPVALGLPVLEVTAGIGLWLNRKGSLALITALLVLFVGLLGYGIVLGLDVDCGCFGQGDPEAKAFQGLRGALYRDLAMLAIIAVVFGCRQRDYQRL